MNRTNIIKVDTMSNNKLRIDQYGHIYEEHGKRTLLHVGRRLPGESDTDAIRRVKRTIAEYSELSAIMEDQDE